MPLLLLLLVLLSGCSSTPPPPPRAPTPPPARPSPAPVVELPEHSWRRVVIDAGHGGEDEGALGVSGAHEKDITLSIAAALARELRSRGFEVVETRTEDRAVSLMRRMEVANASASGLFVSVHANSAPGSGAHGVETYWMDVASDEAAARLAEQENRVWTAAGRPRLEADALQEVLAELRQLGRAELSRELAQVLHHKLIAQSRALYGRDAIRDRGVRTAPFWVLVDAQMPSVLVEVGYLTDADEEQRLRNRGYHRVVAGALADGIEEWVARRDEGP